MQLGPQLKDAVKIVKLIRIFLIYDQQRHLGNIIQNDRLVCVKRIDRVSCGDFPVLHKQGFFWAGAKNLPKAARLRGRKIFDLHAVVSFLFLFIIFLR